MAKGHGFFNSFNITDFKLKNVGMNAIKLLSNGSKFIYDSNRIKWTDDLDSLKNYVKNVIGLTGAWKSPGEYAKQFKSSTFDFILNWYPGKQNSILVHGKHGELFKAVLLTVLKGDCQGWVA